MTFKLDKHQQLHIITPSNDPKIIAEVYVTAEKTEQLALMLLPIAKKYLSDRG